MDALQQDLRTALRALRNQPAFVALAVLTLALGIGAATAMFSVIQNVLLDPFPYVDANRVVMPQIRDARSPEQGGQAWFKPREFLEFQARKEIFAEVIGSAGELLLYTTREGTERLTGTLCTANTFQFLGVPALLGRTLDANDVRPGAPPVFVMRHNFWRTRCNSDPAVLGQTFVLNGVPRTLVGIMPPRFTKGDGDFYLPVAIDPADPLDHAAAIIAAKDSPLAKHVFVPYGQKDTYAPPATQFAYIVAAGLAVAQQPASVTTPDDLGKAPVPVPVGGNADGKTAVTRQYVPNGFDGHFVVFDDADAKQNADRFLADVVNGVTPQLGR